MKRLDCDQVFDVLTRGPFPTGAPIDLPVERHLACCHECRQLAEALRPAVELFHESIEPEDCRDLPGYHGVLAPQQGRGLAQMVADAIRTEPAPSRPAPALLVAPRYWSDKPLHRAGRFLLAMGGGALIAALLLALGLWNSNDSSPKVAKIVPTEVGLQQLAALKLPQSCVSWEPRQTAQLLRCCTECHAAGQKSRGLSAMKLTLVATNCKACHQ